jgi:hypothetical protein
MRWKPTQSSNNDSHPYTIVIANAGFGLDMYRTLLYASSNLLCITKAVGIIKVVNPLEVNLFCFCEEMLEILVKGLASCLPH